jgi:hypothetical protein
MVDKKRNVTDRSTYLRWLIPATSFRLPVAILPLAIEYVIGSTANFQLASLVVGALGVGELSVVAIVTTRLGHRVALLDARVTLWLLAIADSILMTASLIHPLLVLSLPTALCTGALTALGNGQLRRTLTDRLSPPSLQRYLSWDAVALEFAYLVAPGLITLQVAFAETRVLLVLPTILAILTPVVLGQPSEPAASPVASGRITLRAWLWALSAGEGLVEGMVVVTIVPIASDLIHHAAFGAISMVVLSIGSIIGGTIYSHLGTHSKTIVPQRRIAILLLGLSLCLIIGAIADTNEWLLAAVLFGFGGCIAPTNGLRTFAATHRFEARLHGAAFSMIYSSYSIGSVTAAIAFALLDHTLTLGTLLVLSALGTIALAVAYLLTHPRPRRS